MKCWTASFCIHAINGPIIIMHPLKSIYNSLFKNSHSLPIHTCLATIASNDIGLSHTDENGTKTNTGNGTGKIGNSGSWSLSFSLSHTSMNIFSSRMRTARPVDRMVRGGGCLMGCLLPSQGICALEGICLLKGLCLLRGSAFWGGGFCIVGMQIPL